MEYHIVGSPTITENFVPPLIFPLFLSLLLIIFNIILTISVSTAQKELPCARDRVIIEVIFEPNPFLAVVK